MSTNDNADSAIFNANIHSHVHRGCFVAYDDAGGIETLVCKPSGALATKIAGCVEDERIYGMQVVRFVKKGRTKVRSDGSGAINQGDKLVIANHDGEVMAKPASVGVDPFDVVGTAVQSAPATADYLFDADIDVDTEYTS